jgi:hypothetical protein
VKAYLLEYRIEDVSKHGLPRDRYIVLTENETDEIVDVHRLSGYRLVGRFPCEFDADYLPLNEVPLFEH